ncbi:MAG TPA: Mu transposase C-terminal domain-containing protein [Desulfatiglandales bacterium]|nr:Mu transposase C-terminal domain-containing protein [Desulfatiglandales bacterium]
MGSSYTAAKIAEAIGVSKRAINKRAIEWKAEIINGKGERRFMFHDLPLDIQKQIVSKNDIPLDLLPTLSPEVALAAAKQIAEEEADLSIYKGIANTMPTSQNPPDRWRTRDGWQAWTDDTALALDDLKNPKIINKIKIVQEALDVPRGWKKRKWIENVALKHDTTFATIYRDIKKYQKKGLAGLKHTKPAQKNNPKSWTPEAVEFWIGMCLKKSHRKTSKKGLYQVLIIEAAERGWRIGSYESALWWREKRITPQLLALQRGGVRALDNTLPPVLRDYSDLAPFEILVGDQHKFDFWVTDEETGEVFRPECYLWQDLRTRCFYGAAFDRHYDAHLIGLALRMGMMLFGPFDTIYTDNGKPELSRYIMGIMKEMHALGLFVRNTIDIPVDLTGIDPEQINPYIILPGTHKKAIVRNAKAKLIENTNLVMEGILRNQFRVPGHVKKLGGNQEENEVDQKEIDRLAASGKLLTFREFVITVYKAMDWYNFQKTHRGVLREWSWRPKPVKATPMDCLRACYAEGWRPVRLSQEAVDLIFLAKDPRTRTVDRGTISFRSEFYRHDKLIKMNGEKVDIRFDPFDPEWLLVFHNGEYVCRAEPVEYSSMKNLNLAARKIEEKRRLRKSSISEYRQLTSTVPDFTEYSNVPTAERPAALIGRDIREQKARQEANKELYRERTAEELAAEVAALEGKAHSSKLIAHSKKLPARPSHFMTDYDRYKWIVEFEMAGGTLSDEDETFKITYETQMNEGQREHWEVIRELGC